MTGMEVATKRCGNCAEEKPLSQFHRSKGARDGVAWECKTCATARAKASIATRRQEMGDDAWRAHQAEIMRRYRSDPANRRADRVQARARNRALEALREMYPDAFEALLRVERSKLGLNPERQQTRP